MKIVYPLYKDDRRSKPSSCRHLPSLLLYWYFTVSFDCRRVHSSDKYLFIRWQMVFFEWWMIYLPQRIKINSVHTIKQSIVCKLLIVHDFSSNGAHRYFKFLDKYHNSMMLFLGNKQQQYRSIFHLINSFLRSADFIHFSYTVLIDSKQSITFPLSLDLSTFVR